jgi:DnaJ-domain-containing protein 1
LYALDMAIALSILAILVTTIAPLLVAIVVFVAALHAWIDRRLRSDPVMQDKLQLAISQRRIAWTLVLDASALHRWPHVPLVCAALAGVAVALVETITFASRSSVQFLWYQSGSIAAVIALAFPFVVAGLFPNWLQRFIDRKLMKQANTNFAYAVQTLIEIREIAQQVDASYGAMGLRTRANIPDLCRQALLGHAGRGDDSALAGLLGLKHRLEHDLHHVQYCAYHFTNALAELEQAKAGLHENRTMRDTIEKVDNMVHSQDLADILEEARWREAYEWLEPIRFNLRRLLDIAFRDCTMPLSVEDAYRVLNVANSTPLNDIRAIVKAFQRAWHPDLVRDEIDQQRFTLKIQQINGAWDLIQEARA